MSFLDSLADSFDPEGADYYDPRLPLARYERSAPPFPSNVKSAAMQDVAREEESYGTRMLKGAFHDVADIGTGLTSLAMMPFTSEGRSLIGRGAYAVATDPINTAKAFGQAIIDPYTPKEGEDFTDVAKRRVLDHPLSTLMDLAGAVSGVGMGAKGLGIVAHAPSLASAGEKIVEAAAMLDPIQGALKTGEKLGYTFAPSMMKKRDMRRALGDLQEKQNLAMEVATRGKQERISALYGQMTPEERAMFHPYAEGQMSFLPNDPADPIGFKMDSYKEEWEAIHTDWERQLGFDPDTAAKDAVTQAWNNKVSKMAPEDARVTLEEVHADALQKATEAQQVRRTVAGRDVVYDAKRAAWNKAAAATKLENAAAGVAEETHWLNPFPDLLDSDGQVNELADAFTKLIPVGDIGEYAAGQGAIYVPHMREVLSHEQATVPNLLSKAHEAIPTKFNTGAMQRTGMLDLLRPYDKVRRAREALVAAAASGDSEAGRLAQKALEETGQPLLHSMLATNVAVARRVHASNVWEEAGKTWGTKLSGDALDNVKLMKDVRYAGDAERGIAPTHQLLWPNGRMQMYHLSMDAEEILDGLAKHADATGVDTFNLADQVRKMAARVDKTIAVKKGTAYLIPNELGAVVHETVTAHAPITSDIMNAIEKGTDLWRFTTLNMRPAWVLNNVAGNLIFNSMYGLHPLNPASYKTYFDTFRAWGAKKYGWFGDEGAKLAKVYDLPGIAQGGLYGSEAVGGASRTGTALRESTLRPARLLGGIGEGIARFNQGVESYFRASAAIYGLKKAQKYQMMQAGEGVLHAMHVGDRLEELAKMGGEELLSQADFKRAYKLTNDALNNYAKQTPFQRNVLRKIMPFQSFYIHALKMGTKYPFEQAAQATLVRKLADVVHEDFRHQVERWGFDPDKDIPQHLKDALPMSLEETPDGSQVIKMLSTKGPNPLSILSGEDPGAEALGSIHPLLKVAIETLTGASLFKLQRFQSAQTSFTGKTINPETGAVETDTARINPVENLLRQFWPYQTLENEVAQGRQRYDTTTLLDMLMHDKNAYRKDAATGSELRKPFSAVAELARPFVTPPHYVQHKTKEQAQADAGVVSEQLNRVWRDASPEQRMELRRILMEKRAQLGAPERPTYRPHH